MKLISGLFTCSLKKIIPSLLSSTMFTPPSASRRHSYNCGVLPYVNKPSITSGSALNHSANYRVTVYYLFLIIIQYYVKDKEPGGLDE